MPRPVVREYLKWRWNQACSATALPYADVRPLVISCAKAFRWSKAVGTARSPTLAGGTPARRNCCGVGSTFLPLTV